MNIVNIDESVKLNENITAHLFFPEFSDNAIVLKERKKWFDWSADLPLSFEKQLLVTTNVS